MIIGIDVSRANRPIKTGVEWYAYYLLKHFYQLDFDNQYLLYTDTPLSNDLKPSIKNFREQVLNWILPKFWTLGRLSWQMLKQRPDVLFVPSHTFPFIGGKRNIITWHDVGYEKYPETYTKWDLASLKQGAKRALKMADKIIAVSNFTKEEIIRFYKINPEKIKVIYPGCDRQIWRQMPEEMITRITYKYGVNLPYFVYLNRLTMRKNPVGMIRIYNRFREKIKQPHQLLLIGKIETMQGEIDDEIKHSPYKNEILKMGWLPPIDLPVIVSGARAMVMPSIYEGFGLPTIEAMSCGCPVLTSMSGSLPEVVSGAGLLNNTHDIEGFAENMVKLCQDNNLREQIRRKGFIRVNDFSWENCAKQTLDLIHNI